MRPEEADSSASPTRVSATACNHRHTSQPTEIRHTRSRATERDSKTAKNPVSGDQKGGLTGPGVSLQVKGPRG
jgi:hypothetical protein